tara:strand:+ start:314 stop:1135 length:822 start_codon:yes stop_codon:yes gene_type:complete
MKICALTGSTGVIGKKLKKNLSFKFYNFKGDITNKKAVNKWINAKDFDLIIHLAAIVPTRKVNKNYLKAKQVNIKGTENLVNALLSKKIKPKWFFFASTSHIYGLGKKYKKLNEKNKPHPTNKYGTTKKIAEDIIKKKLKNNKIDFCIGRIFSVTDTTQKPPYLVPSLQKKIKKSKKTLVLKDLNHFRDFITTNNISSAIKILYKKKKTGIYNIGSGNIVYLKNIAKLIAKKHKKKIKYIDNKKPTYLIADNKKLVSLGWKAKKFSNTLNYFY